MKKLLLLGIALTSICQAQLQVNSDTLIFRTPIVSEEFQRNTYFSPLGVIRYNTPTWKTTFGTVRWIDPNHISYTPNQDFDYDEFITCFSNGTLYVLEISKSIHNLTSQNYPTNIRIFGNDRNPILEILNQQKPAQKIPNKPRDSQRPPNRISWWNPQFPNGPGFWDTRAPRNGEEFLIEKQRSRRFVNQPQTISSGTLTSDKVQTDSNGKVTIGNKNTVGFSVGAGISASTLVNQDYVMQMVTEEWIVDIWIFRNGRWVFSHSERHQRTGYRLVIATNPPIICEISWDPRSLITVKLK